MIRSSFETAILSATPIQALHDVLLHPQLKSPLWRGETERAGKVSRLCLRALGSLVPEAEAPVYMDFHVQLWHRPLAVLRTFCQGLLETLRYTAIPVNEAKRRLQWARHRQNLLHYQAQDGNIWLKESGLKAGIIQESLQKIFDPYPCLASPFLQRFGGGGPP